MSTGANKGSHLKVYSEREWLIRFQRRMQAILGKAKLPHDASREVELLPTLSHHLDDPLDARLLPFPPRGRDALTKRILLAPNQRRAKVGRAAAAKRHAKHQTRTEQYRGEERAFWAAGAEGCPTRTGKPWAPETVRQIVQRGRAG
ncbi:MAG: hypothetical protein ABSA52_23590 [Candidatus Binatia bacterium]|jgi:hypothetical protein